MAAGNDADHGLIDQGEAQLDVAALTAYQLLERFYRQSLGAAAAAAERHRTTEGLLRAFRGYGLIVRRTALGRVVHATRLTPEQGRILGQLGFPTPAQRLAQVLAPLPLG